MYLIIPLRILGGNNGPCMVPVEAKIDKTINLCHHIHYLTWPNPAVQGVDSVSWLGVISTVITRIISCYYWLHLISLMGGSRYSL